MSTLTGNPNYQVVIMQQSTNTNVANINVVAYMPDKFMFDLSSNYDTPFAQGLLGSGMLANVAAVFGYKLVTPAMTAAVWTGSSSSEMSLSLEFFAETNTYNDVTDKVLNLMRLVTPNVDPITGLITSPGPKLTFQGAVNVVKQGANAVKTVITEFGQADTALGKLAIGGVDKFVDILPKDMSNSNTQVNGSTKTTALTQSTSLGGSDIWKNNIDNKVSIKIGNYAFFDCVVVTRVQQTYSSILDSYGKPTHVIIELGFKPMFITTQADINNIFLNVNRG